MRSSACTEWHEAKLEFDNPGDSVYSITGVFIWEMAEKQAKQTLVVML